MSRLHKKKSAQDKIKKKSAATDGTDALVSAKKKASSKSATTANPMKAKQEKSLTDAKPGEPNVFQKAMEFFREVKIELKKVTWPTRKQTTGTTIVVIIFVFVVAAFLGLFDFGLSKLVQVVLT